MLSGIHLPPLPVPLLRDDLHLWQFSAAKKHGRLHASGRVHARPCRQVERPHALPGRHDLAHFAHYLPIRHQSHGLPPLCGVMHELGRLGRIQHIVHT